MATTFNSTETLSSSSHS